MFYQNVLILCPEVEICPRLSYKHKLKSSLPHPFLCSKIHFQILSLSFLSKSFTQLHSDFLRLFNLSLVDCSISVSSNVCLVSKRGRNQRSSVMSKLSVTSPSAPLVKSQNCKNKSFRTIDRSLHDWALAGRLGHNPPESHHRPIPPKLREISSMGPPGPGQNCPATTSTS